VFRATIPYIADSHGSPNCMQCHQVEEGAVLGAITVTLSLSQMKSSALFTVATMVVMLALFVLATLFFIRRATRPLVDTAHDIQYAVGQALEGHFEQRIQVRSSDEIGQIAGDFNQLTAFLERGLRSIRDNVAQLIRCNPSDNSNLLTNTMEMVDGLVDAAHFKQAIEEDENKLEVYQRLARVVEHEFQIRSYSIYEVANSKNRMLPIIVDGEDSSSCRWCDQNITVRAETCRARRTGHTINSLETPLICNAFRPGEMSDAQHICLPIIQSGTVGSVVQLVVPHAQAARISDVLTLLNVYLREAAPVIEAKRLTDTLRESTLRDPMTGLQNRRFLEEYMETIIAQSQRHKTALTVLMLDLDYFKQVNDSYGHDAGDTVIKTLAKLFRSCVRSSDLVIRYGGEEFIIILQETSGDPAMAVAEKIRAEVEQTRIAVGTGIQLQKTISIGLAEYPNDSDTFWQAIKFADVALYQAKENGRNRVVRFLPEMWNNDEQY
jgi:diguanylate cyclase (GGDEF)-like protein